MNSARMKDSESKPEGTLGIPSGLLLGKLSGLSQPSLLDEHVNDGKESGAQPQHRSTLAFALLLMLPRSIFPNWRYGAHARLIFRSGDHLRIDVVHLVLPLLACQSLI